MKLQCVIVDDEPLAIAVMEGLLKKIPNIEVLATFNEALSVLDFLNEHPVDFICLDIEMPNLSGIDFLRSINNPPLAIITSANKSYALEGFELNVVDYILKPVTLERLVKAINKVVELTSTKHPQQDIINQDIIFLKENKRMVRIQLSEILYIESIKDYVKVVTKCKTVITKQNISYFEQILNPIDFIRIHRSFIVAIRRIDAFSSSSVEVGTLEIPIGRLYKDITLSRLGEKGEPIS